MKDEVKSPLTLFRLKVEALFENKPSDDDLLKLLQEYGFKPNMLDNQKEDNYKIATKEVLQILNEPGQISVTIQRVLTVLRKTTGIDAIGIRLQKGDDFPYLDQSGFSSDFVLTENSLIDFDENGHKCRDLDGKVCLACTCGMVLSGKFEPTNPSVTPGGSWWSNDTFQSLKLLADNDERYHPRNKCIMFKYASIALIPIRTNEANFGMIQFNDFRKNVFNIEIIELLEGLAMHIGSAIVRKQAEEVLKESEKRRNAILQTTMDGFWLIDLQGNILEVNKIYSRMSGYSEQELLKMSVSDLEIVESNFETSAHITKIIKCGEDRFESRHRRKDGRLFDVEISCKYQTDIEGRIIVFIHDITKRKRSEIALRESEEKSRLTLKNILSPEMVISDLELDQIIDSPALQHLLEEYYILAQVPMAIIDTQGKVLVQIGWQNVCTRFHRVHPDSCRNCIESDVYLTNGISDGAFKLYKCKNGMWDMATPIIIGGEHKGNLFMGQFFFESEPIDNDAFRKQSVLFGFAENDYFDALNKVPRFSRQHLENVKAFLLILSHLISQLSYSNVKLAKAISLQNQVEKTLLEKDALILKAQEIAHLGSWSLDLRTNSLTWSDQIFHIFGLKLEDSPATYEGFLDAIHPDDRDAVDKMYIDSLQQGKGDYEIEHRIIRKNSGELRYVNEKCEHIKDSTGKIIRSVGMIQDITERKLKEEALRKLNKTLAALSKSSLALTQSFDEEDYLKRVCQIVVEDTDFSMVWIGFAEKDELKTVRPVASAGFTDDYIDSIQIRWDDSEYGRGPTGTAIRTGQLALCNNMSTDPNFKPWREKALKRGFASSIVLPLKSEGEVFGAISIYSNQTDAFFDDEIKLLSELANDLASGITTIHLRAAQKLAEETLSKSYLELEKLVEARTKELQLANKLLNKEIVKRKQHEQNLVAAEKKYRTVADFTANWEFWMGHNHQLYYCSPSCERITGYTASEFLKDPRLFFFIVHPADRREFLQHNKNELNYKVYKNEIQYRIIRKDGAIRWLAHICQPVFDENGQFNGTRGSNKDITERKITEALLLTSNQKYELLSENINDGIFICKNGKFEYENNTVYQLFGYEKGELDHLNLTDLVQTDRKVELETFLNSNGETDQNFNFEVCCVKKDQSTIVVEMLLKYNAIEKMVYGVIQDISAKTELQRNILKAIIQTEEKERSHFSKELHDGLGPLLTTIKIYLESLMRPKSEQIRNEIIQNAHDIIEESLTTVKEISNNLSPHLLTNYGLQSAIKSFIEKLNKTTELDIFLESNEYNRLPEEIEATLYRSIIECINNTMKHGNAKIIYIKMNTSKNLLFLNYVDDGVGFDVNEVLAKQTGLGLFNLQNRIQNIGGKLELTSMPGKGVNYKFYITI